MLDNTILSILPFPDSRIALEASASDLFVSTPIHTPEKFRDNFAPARTLSSDVLLFGTKADRNRRSGPWTDAKLVAADGWSENASGLI